MGALLSMGAPPVAPLPESVVDDFDLVLDCLDVEAASGVAATGLASGPEPVDEVDELCDFGVAWVAGAEAASLVDWA
jgi:hypothetical protein